MDLDFGDLATREELLSCEWLETDGHGGFSAGALGWAPVRRFHGLLIVAKENPAERQHLLAHLAEVIELGSARFSLGIVPAPDAQPARLAAFSTWPWPTWRYELGDVQLTREVLRPKGEESVLVRYRLSGPRTASLTVRPLLTGRPAGKTHRSTRGLDPSAQTGSGWIRWQPHAKSPAVYCHAKARYTPAPLLEREVRYPIDQERGEPSRDVWLSPGVLELSFDGKGECALAFSTRAAPPKVPEAFEAAWAEREAWLRASPTDDPLFQELHRAARSFLCETPEGPLLIAGFPWFPPVARDTFTALPGLLLATGHPNVARGVLELFARQCSRGMIPHLPKVGDQKPSYESIDSSLWFVHAVGSYLRATGDFGFVGEVCWRAVREILEGYRHGTRYRIRMDDDGLITSSGYHTKLTWMDAAYRGHVYTPRQGKAVEVQALWIQALEVGARLAEHFGDGAFARTCREDRQRAVRSFRERFWFEQGGYLYDVVDGWHGDDSRLRPNQLYALAFEGELVPRERALRILEVIESELLTPMGLRSLDPNDRRYHGRYAGPRSKRDPAYHNGTAWPWLFGPYVRAVLKVRGTSDAERQRMRALLERFCDFAMKESAGHLPEILDGDPPHIRRGCFAQAWNCGELLLVLSEELLDVRRAPASAFEPQPSASP